MNRNDIIRIAQEAGLHIATDVKWMPIIGLEYAEKFAALVASAERKRCVARADIALLGADITLRNRVLKAINITGQA